MKAAILTELNAPLTVGEVILPGVLYYGQVLVRVIVSGICGAQIHQEISGNKGNAGHLPHLLGHEGAGIVEGIGLGVTRVKVGDKVVLHWRKAAGIDAPFPLYSFRGSPMSGGKVTTFNERAVVSENRVTPVPASTPDELCALLGCGLSTALATVENEANLKSGQSILIIGVGGLGVNLIRAAALRQAWPIVAVDVQASKRQLAFDMGATEFHSVYSGRGEGARYDVIIDTSGSPQAIGEMLPLLASGGRFILVGQPKPGQAISLLNARHLFDGEGKTILATQGGRFQPDLDIPRYVRMHAAGLLKLEGIITHRLPLDDINEGLDLVRQGEASRVLIQMPNVPRRGEGSEVKTK